MSVQEPVNPFQQAEEKPEPLESSESSVIDVPMDQLVDGEGNTRRYKMVFLVRTDLKMGAGKLCAQCGHAVSRALREPKKPSAPGQEPRKNYIDAWRCIGEKKVALKVQDYAELEALVLAARQRGLPSGVIADAGHTQVEPGTITVGWIGPWLEEEIDAVTGRLRLL